MTYEQLTIKLPANLADIAAKIGRALDPDRGGAESFVLADDALTISASTYCTPVFKQQAAYLLAHPAALHAACAADYSVRWAEFDAPTLDECEAFCEGVIVEKAVQVELP